MYAGPSAMWNARRRIDRLVTRARGGNLLGSSGFIDIHIDILFDNSLSVQEFTFGTASKKPSTIKRGPPMCRTTSSGTVSLGFTVADDGVLTAPSNSVVTLAPIGSFYELRISLGDGNAIRVVVPRVAVKITSEGAKPCR